MDIKTISHMLGHTDAGFTMNTYMHVTNNMQQTVADAMGNLIIESENERKTSSYISLHNKKGSRNKILEPNSFSGSQIGVFDRFYNCKC